jgi:Ca2+-binding EF-hand superfamily protein
VDSADRGPSRRSLFLDPDHPQGRFFFFFFFFLLNTLFKNLGHATSNDEVAHMMAKADTNDDDDFISLAEFATLNATMVGETAIGPPTRTSGCQAVRVFNANNGTISAAELVRVLCSLGKSTFVVHLSHD